MLSTGFSFLHL